MFHFTRWYAAVGLLSLFALAAGCGNGAAPDTSTGTPPAATTPSAAALAALAKADAADGTTDKVVSTCTMCMLGMAGKAEHTATYGEYTLHFCSNQCTTAFEKDPEKALLRLK